MDRNRVEQLKEYIFHYDAHFEKYFAPLCDVKDKRILIIGSGWGAETFWSLRNGARFVLGVDPAERNDIPLVAALNDRGVQYDGRFELRRALTSDINQIEIEPFDFIISNNVMEHVFDLAGTLGSCKNLIPNRGGRIIIFTDPLFYSSAGAHLDITPWGHLTENQSELQKKVASAEWEHYRTELNGMTITTFLEAVREAGLWIDTFSILKDRYISRFQQYSPAIPSGIKPMDLLCEGICCSLGFPHNI